MNAPPSPEDASMETPDAPTVDAGLDTSPPLVDAPSDSSAVDRVVSDGPIDQGAPPNDAARAVAEAGAFDCSTAPLCDDFESDTPQMPPDPSLWHVYMGCNPNSANAPVSGGGLTVGIDTSTHHSGTNSLRIVGGDSCGFYAINTSAFSKLGQEVYARFYARFSGGGTGADAGAATMGHNGFLSMFSGSTPGTAADFFANYNSSGMTSGQLRLGFQSNVVDWNDIISGADSTLPDLDPMGTVLSVSPGADVWDCYEFHIDQTNNHIEFWFNSAPVTGLGWSGTTVQGVDDQWATKGPPPLQLQSFGVGWLQLNNQETAWYDDVALAETRIGCQ